MFKRAILVGLLAIIVSGCSNEGVSQQTLVAFEAQLDTQREVVGATRTAELELLLLTLDYSYVELTRTKSQYDSMNAILVTRGVTVEVPTMMATEPAPNTSEPFITPDADQPIVDVIVTPFMTPTAEIIPTATPNENGVTTSQDQPPIISDNLRDIALSATVGEDDCANGVTSTFNTSSERIYIVARAFDIVANTEISSTWWRGGEQVANFTFMPSFPINNACIWFFADPTDFDFSAGGYEVILQLNGQDVTPPIPFNILGNTTE